MAEDPIPSRMDQETLQPEQAAQLLQRQQMLQEEAQVVLEELDLVNLLSASGSLRQVGSSTLGLMTWRDLDLAVSSPGLDVESIYELMRPLYTHQRVKRVHYLNESGSYNATGNPEQERYFFMVHYETLAGNEWKIDISFWLGLDIHPEPVQDALEQQLTPETRLAILWIKNACYQLPTYRSTFYSTDIYEAVAKHGVRTPKEFEEYLARSARSMYPRK
ncbi:MAG: hypothetical protein H0U76_10235 [Ktedonobacteraceae bacterium]|nr:hypothetical protein [Ktedonobacteraceae bacterium]